ncbi:uncharacterized protein LOC133845437 [Drosophila sulfurigaster albostrigata]|uniref:uncharacterized protein LOC133845437 n=1 Tax=Drosophila sulfurigaster albostrigata TaxID=89887 RepID=UPI002D219170|nr:uncharacterized protein LOC133845437 [Drosophila sulfurigaster albostrigata]
MLEGWYCRSLANQKATTGNIEQESDDELQTKPSAAVSGQVPGASSSASTGTANVNVDYKERYRNLKRKLKFLIYENEYFQDLLHTNQRRLLKVSRDRSFLIDRLLLYEKPAKDSSDSDATDSSNSDAEPTTSTSTGMQLPNTLDTTKEAAALRKKHKEKMDAKMAGPPTQQLVVSGATRGRKRKVLPGGGGGMVHQQLSKKPLITTATVSPSLQHQHQVGASNTLSTAEITRQLQERRPTPIELMSPECASATVPATMLSDESPSKLYPNESLQHLMEDDSPSHVAAEECVPMVYTT